MRRTPFDFIFILCVGCAAIAACDAPTRGIELWIPDYPAWTDSMYTVDQDQLEDQAGAYCSESPDSGAGRAIELLANERLDVALGAGGPDLLAASKDAVPALLAIYGYNLGYLRVLIEHPPQGADPPSGLLECKSFLDCTSSTAPLEVLDLNRSVLTNLTSPPSERWRDWNEAIARIEESSAGSGRSVWEGILSGSTVRPDAYVPLLTLSAGYLMVGEAAVLVNMDAWATADVERARCGLLLDAGLQVWSTSYFLGLASPAPAGTFPRLKCPPR